MIWNSEVRAAPWSASGLDLPWSLDAGPASGLTLACVETPLGPMVLMASPHALLMAEFAQPVRVQAQMKILTTNFTRRASFESSPAMDQAIFELNEYFLGRRTQFEVSVELRGTPFQVQVWEQLLEIPAGRTLSYGDLADEIGAIDGARAVGRAVGANRLAIFVPCHRVLKADGSLCGYAGELWRKRRLLELEAGQMSMAWLV